MSDYEQRRHFNIKEKEMTIPRKQSLKLSEISKPKPRSKKRKKNHLQQEESSNNEVMSAVRRSFTRSKKPKLQNTYTEEPIAQAEFPFSCWQCHQSFEFQDQVELHMTEYHGVEAEPLTRSVSSNIELDTSTENMNQEQFSEQQITSPSRNHEIDAFPTQIMNDSFPSELLPEEMQIDHTDESGNEDDMIQPNGNPEINITSQLSPRNFNQSESIDHTSLKEYVMNRESNIN